MATNTSQMGTWYNPYTKQGFSGLKPGPAWVPADPKTGKPILNYSPAPYTTKSISSTNKSVPSTVKTTSSTAKTISSTSTPKITSTPTPASTSTSSYEKYLKELQKQLTPSVDTSYLNEINKIQKEYDNISKQLEQEMKGLENFQAKRYDEEYTNAGLGDIKNKISEADKQIQDWKNRMEEAISEERATGRLGATARTISGAEARIREKTIAEINNLIDYRNSLAEKYNTSLNEIEKKIAREAADKATKITNLQTALNQQAALISSYQTEMQNRLKEQRETEKWLTEIGLKMADAENIAKKEKEEAPKIYTDPLTYTTYYWDTAKGQYRPISEVMATATAGIPGILGTSEEKINDNIIRSEILRAYNEGRKYGAILNEIKKRITDKNELTKWIEILKEEERKRQAAGKGTTTFWERLFQSGI